MVCGDLGHDLLPFVAVIIQTYTASVDEFGDVPDCPRMVSDASDEYLEWLLIGAWSGDLPTTLIGDAGDFGVLLTP